MFLKINRPANYTSAGRLYGGLEEIRTPDPHNANVVRSQLRYKPVSTYRDIIAPQEANVKKKLQTDTEIIFPC